MADRAGVPKGNSANVIARLTTAIPPIESQGLTGAPANFHTAHGRAIFDRITNATTDAALVECSRAIWSAFGGGQIDAETADTLARYVAARRPPAGEAACVGAMAGRVVGAAYSRARTRQRPRSPDRQASRERRRKWARSGHMPSQLRVSYTEGQAAALEVVANEVKQRGDCKLPIDKIAALAGVCRTTVQNALHEARRLGHVLVTERPQRGRKSLTNVVEIVSVLWRAWARLPLRGIGSKTMKTVSPTKTEESIKADVVRVVRPQGAWNEEWRNSVPPPRRFADAEKLKQENAA
jgi:hypothetical protein